MDKDVMKRLLRDAGLPVAKFISLERHQQKQFDLLRVIEKLGLPLFVKPANLGSSVGVSKVKKEQDLLPSIEKAFQYDRKILIEEYIRGREIECALIGNEEPLASLPGEVIPKGEFHCYEAKYVDGMAEFKIPADLPPDVVRRVQTLAIKTYQTICCEGMARVDFFLTPDHQVIINEINTIPGFTKLSMFPRIWEASGIPMSQLIDHLITFAIERFEKEKGLKTTF
jgi:D-alanine-D-alanine ligase